jgi:osmotically-inducible protein OsmY
MRNALLFAMSMSMIGFTGCNKSSQEKASEKAAEVREDADKAMQDIKEEAQKAAAKVQDQAREAVSDIKENAADARKNIANEAGKTNDAVNNAAGANERRTDADVRDDAREAKNDVKTESRQTSRDTKVEARQTNRDLHEALGMDQGRTEADKKLNDRIRAALKNNKTRDAGDISLETVNGNVQLKGTVASEEAKKDIASVARKVAGLTHVTDDIKVADRVGQGAND